MAGSYFNLKLLLLLSLMSNKSKKVMILFMPSLKEEGVYCFALVCPSVHPSVLYNLVQLITRVCLGPAFSNFIQILVIERRSALLIIGVNQIKVKVTVTVTKQHGGHALFYKQTLVLFYFCFLYPHKMIVFWDILWSACLFMCLFIRVSVCVQILVSIKALVGVLSHI